MLILALVVIAVIGGIGSYVYLRSSDAATMSCGSGYSLKKVFRGDYGSENGEVRVYSKQAGRNTDWCAFTVHKGVTYGKKMETHINIVGYAGTYGAGKGVSVTDLGKYSYYAGPVKVSNKPKLRVYGDIRGKVDGEYANFTLLAKYLSN